MTSTTTQTTVGSFGTEFEFKIVRNININATTFTRGSGE
jgi:hypothetical protein